MVSSSSTPTITANAPKRIPRVTPRTKEKTCGTPDPAQAMEPGEGPEALLEDQTKIKVDQKADQILEFAFKTIK